MWADWRIGSDMVDGGDVATVSPTGSWALHGRHGGANGRATPHTLAAAQAALWALAAERLGEL